MCKRSLKKGSHLAGRVDTGAHGHLAEGYFLARCRAYHYLPGKCMYDQLSSVYSMLYAPNILVGLNLGMPALKFVLPSLSQGPVDVIGAMPAASYPGIE